MVKGRRFSDDCRVRDGHRSKLQSGDVHVQHAVRMQHSVQDEAAIHYRNEQGCVFFATRWLAAHYLLQVWHSDNEKKYEYMCVTTKQIRH